MSLCGPYNAPSTLPVTISVQTLSQFDDVVMGSSKAEAASSIEWSIVDITHGFPSPLLVNSVTSSSAGVEGVHRAYITNPAGTVAINSQDGSWLSSCAHTATGDVTCTIASGIYSGNPLCVVTRNLADGNAFSECDIAGVGSSTSVEVKCNNSTNGALADNSFNLLCMGPH
jgi:hypothetical protein